MGFFVKHAHRITRPVKDAAAMIKTREDAVSGVVKSEIAAIMKKVWNTALTAPSFLAGLYIKSYWILIGMTHVSHTDMKYPRFFRN